MSGIVFCLAVLLIVIIFLVSLTQLDKMSGAQALAIFGVCCIIGGRSYALFSGEMKSWDAPASGALMQRNGGIIAGFGVLCVVGAVVMASVKRANSQTPVDHLNDIVLVIDDELHAVEPLLQALKAQGYPVAYASSGEEGVALAREIRPSVILCDLLMPGMTGRDVLDAVRAELPEQELILMHKEWVLGTGINAWSHCQNGNPPSAHWEKPINVKEYTTYIGRIFRSLREVDSE